MVNDPFKNNMSSCTTSIYIVTILSAYINMCAKVNFLETPIVRLQMIIHQLINDRLDTIYLSVMTTNIPYTVTVALLDTTWPSSLLTIQR